MAMLFFALSALVDVSLYDLLLEDVDTSPIKNFILDEVERHSWAESLTIFQIADIAKRLAIYASFVLLCFGNLFVENNVKSTVKDLQKIHNNFVAEKKKFDGGASKGKESSADVALNSLQKIAKDLETKRKEYEASMKSNYKFLKLTLYAMMILGILGLISTSMMFAEKDAQTTEAK